MKKMNGLINYSNRKTTKQNRNLTPISKNYNSNRIEINYPLKRNFTNINNQNQKNKKLKSDDKIYVLIIFYYFNCRQLFLVSEFNKIKNKNQLKFIKQNKTLKL